jgi:phosphohistidine phosphatase
MGERLRSLDPPPDLLVSSPAIRAVTTARVIAAAIEYPEGEIELRPEIYEAGCFTLLTLIRDLPGHADHVMLFGHNPGFTDLANLLQPEPIDNVPTCGVVRMAFKVDSWTEIDEQGGHLLDFDSPRKGRRE